MTKQLPDTPSKLIRLALADLAKVEAGPQPAVRARRFPRRPNPAGLRPSRPSTAAHVAPQVPITPYENSPTQFRADMERLGD